MSTEPFDYSKLENDFFTQVNAFRKEPSSLVPILEETIKNYKNGILYRPGEIPIQTSEGVSAVEECIEVLKTTEPMPEFKRSPFLDQACKDHATDIGSRGLVNHDGSDGSNVSDRIERYAEWEGTCAENIDFGSKEAINCLIDLLIDDGVEKRGHRKNLMNPAINYIGVASHAHKEYEICVVIDLVSNIRDKDQPFFDHSTYKYQFPEDLDKKPESKPKKIKNNYQLDDEDAPDETVAVKTIKQTKLFNGKVHRVTKKFYTLSDGSTTIVEVEDI
mmetsp:Transcript_38478/g.39907  ORF Transcript_38478/g.39907 Transcript_38478/m.39907 type:complete len:275 (-) Transcript_38478:122-946(-)